jgi:hypothetical protein
MIDIQPNISEETNGTPIRFCKKCGKPFPATSEYFYLHAKNESQPYLRSSCKNCYNSSRKKNGVERRRDETEQQCPTCQQTRPLTSEYFSSYVNKGGTISWYSKCRICDTARRSSAGKRKKIQQVVKREPVGTPDQCGSCSTTQGNIVGDIESTTHERYGYLCARCYRMLLECQKDVPRIRKVLAYLELTRPG